MTHPHERALEAAARALALKALASEMKARGYNDTHASEYADEWWPAHLDRARAAVTAYIAALQETHALVPREATVGMFRALTHSWPDDLQKGVWLLGSFAEDYRAMIDAAPPAAQEPRP